jgi:hypothetical protein
VSIPSFRATTGFDGNNLIVEIDADVFGHSQVRARFDASNLHPLTHAATDPSLFELLDLCVAYYALDRSTRRPNNGFARRFTIRLPVADASRWQQHRDLLTELFLATTGDLVEVIPLQRNLDGDHHRRPPVLPLDQGVDSVALLSDGLDSLCGADAISRDPSKRFAFASVVTTHTRLNRMNAVVHLAERQSGRTLSHHTVVTRLTQQIKVKEKTQRSRTVLAIVTGMTVAALLKAKRVECSENGFGLLNLPIPDLQYGAMASQVLQPSHLPLWDRLSRAFFGETIELYYPNRYRTKAQMVQNLSKDAMSLVRTTSSCDSEYRKKGVGVLHCGLCGSCRIRRRAIARSPIIVPDAVYAEQRMNRRDPDALLCLRYHAGLLDKALSARDPWEELVRLQPELALLPYSDDRRVHLPEREMASYREQIQTRTMALLRRHVSELQEEGSLGNVA